MGTYVNVKAGLIAAFSYIFYLRMSNMGTVIRKKITFGLGYNIVIAIIIKITAGYVEEPFKSLVTILLSSIFLKVGSKQKYKNTIIDMITALAASYILYILSSTVVVAVFYYILKIRMIDFRLALLTCVIEIFFTTAIMRMKMGIIVQKEKYIGGIGLLLSGMIIIFYSLFREKWDTYNGLWLIILGIGLCAFGLLYWLKKESIITFNSKAGSAENMKLIDRLNDAEKENKFLDDTLRYMESRLHKEDKRLPAYQQAVEELIYESTDEENKVKAIKLLNELKEARNELTQEQIKKLRNSKILPLTGMVLLDAVFANMHGRAVKFRIDFDLIIEDNLIGIIDIITQVQLETLAADLIINAITAVLHSSKNIKKIFVYFMVLQGVYELRVEDTGIPFEVNTFMHLGKQRITTHGDVGGSGIGFMTIFEIINSCNASLYIVEVPQASHQNLKTVAVRFDNEGKRIIKTYRALQISAINDGRWIIEDYND